MPLTAGDISAVSRTVQYRDDWPIPRVYTRTGFSTELALAKAETVVKVLVSNNYFGANFTGNKVVLKAMGDEPGHAGDVRIYAASGNEYAVIIEEVTKKPTAADLRVIILTQDPAAKDAMNGKPQLYTAEQMQASEARSAAELAQLKQQLDSIREVSKQQQEKAQRATQMAATKEADNLHHDYELYGRKGEDFHPVVYRDDKFTHVEVTSQETPVLYEIKDGKLSQVGGLFVGGKYTAPKIIDEGVLKVGKSQVKFRRIHADS